MQQTKFLSTLGLARRAGKLNYGFDMVTEGLDTAQLIFLTADVSARTRNSVMQLAARKGVTCYDLPLSMAEISVAIGTKPVGIVSITEEGFAALLLAERKKMIGGKPL
ncbi:MAG: ribosomal L7Ae/L30e/S12e/Gadd45 family protein [Clostridia bacterium]|nr:ribosomal L7Ae/L30e/S12e/Gadd45 family protein [Clostridia bacterium]